MLLNPDIMKTLFPIVTGILMVTKSTLDLRIALLLQKYNYENWLSIFICAIISIVCGLIIIINPSIGTIALTTYLGIIITVYAISNIMFVYNREFKCVYSLNVCPRLFSKTMYLSSNALYIFTTVTTPYFL